VVRWATLVLVMLVGCNDLRDFRGTWRGARVGQQGTPQWAGGGSGLATLVIDLINSHELSARLAIDGLLPEAAIASLPGAEADALASITFDGNPLRVYLAFVAIPDGGGEALVVVAVYDDRRVEVRLLRGGAAALYGIFALTEAPG
jgi:hypothetical protein